MALTDAPRPEARLTRSDGFAVELAELPDARIGVLRGMDDLAVLAGDTRLVLISSGVFGHVNSEARIELSLALADGTARPSWLRLNGLTGQLLVQAPDGVSQELRLILTATDQDAQSASTVFVLKVEAAKPTPEGRQGFSDKLRQSTGVTLSASLFNLGGILSHGQH